MIYAYDQAIQMPTRDLYDTLIMAMAINAAKDMYEKGQLEMKDFNTMYGDFMTPIAKDLDYYNKNVLDPVRNTINAIYAAGGDPLRSPEARALISRAINSVNSGDVAKLKQSAVNANEFLKAKAKLELAGLYNPMYSKYDHPDMSTYSTLGVEGQGVWDKMSPTPYQDMADFTKSYFEGIKPITRAASKNGISYTKSEITEDDLRNIADAHFNDLVNTPQGQLMYKKFLDDFNQDENAAKKAFSDSVVAGNLKRLFYQDDYNDNWYKNQNLALKRMQLLMQERIAQIRAAAKGKSTKSSNGNGGSNKEEFNYHDYLRAQTATNVIGNTSFGPVFGMSVSDYDPDKVAGFMGQAQEEIANQAYGLNSYDANVSIPGYASLGNVNLALRALLANGIYSYDPMRLNFTPSQYSSITSSVPNNLTADLLKQGNEYMLSRMSVESDPKEFAEGTGRSTMGSDKTWVFMNREADKGKIYSADEVALTSAGVDRPQDAANAVEKTKKLRAQFSKNFEDGKTMMQSAGYVVGRVGKDGAQHLFQKIRIVNARRKKADSADSDGDNASSYEYDDLFKNEYLYYDMGIDTQGNPNYLYDGMENLDPAITDRSFWSNTRNTRNAGVTNTNSYAGYLPSLYDGYFDLDDEE